MSISRCLAKRRLPMKSKSVFVKGSGRQAPLLMWCDATCSIWNGSTITTCVSGQPIFVTWVAECWRTCKKILLLHRKPTPIARFWSAMKSAWPCWVRFPAISSKGSSRYVAPAHPTWRLSRVPWEFLRCWGWWICHCRAWVARRLSWMATGGVYLFAPRLNSKPVTPV